MKDEQEKKLLSIVEKQQQVILKLEELQTNSQSMVNDLSHATHDQTNTFILQINKLSKRLDAREEEVRNLEKLLEEQNKQINSLLTILHDATRKGDINNNTYNNM